MKRLAKWSGLLTIVVLCVSILNGVYLDIDRSELEAKYGGSSSKFMLMENGSRIHYRDEGHAEKTPLVLIHGFNGSLFNFSKLVPLIADDFRVISLDLPGFGLTGAVPTNDYSTENFIQVVQELSQELELGKFLIAGNSMGGGVSWRFALDYPDQLLGLILLASSGVRVEQSNQQMEQRERETPIAWRLMRSDVMKSFLTKFTPKFFATQGLSSSVYDQELATSELANQFHELTLMEGSRAAILSMFGSRTDRSGFSGPEIFRDIVVPTLVIHGKEDNIIDVGSSKYFQENIPNVEVKIYEKIGHLPMYEAPQKTARDIKDFAEFVGRG